MGVLSTGEPTKQDMSMAESELETLHLIDTSENRSMIDVTMVGIGMLSKYWPFKRKTRMDKTCQYGTLKFIT